MSSDSCSTVALVLVAAEINELPDALAARLGDDVTVDPITGIRVISIELGRHILETRRVEQRQQRQRDEQIAAEWERGLDEQRRTSQALHDRVAAIAARGAALRASGTDLNEVPAFAVMCGAETEKQLQAAGDRFDEMLFADRAGLGGVGATISRPRQEGRP